MASSNWKVLEDSDDDVAAPANAVGAAGAQADKKKRKKAKKKNPATAATSESTSALSSSGGALEHVLAKAIESGFTKAAAEAAIEAMWNEKLAYDDADAVVARLRGKVAASVAPPTKAAVPVAVAPPAKVVAPAAAQASKPKKAAAAAVSAAAVVAAPPAAPAPAAPVAPVVASAIVSPPASAEPAEDPVVTLTRTLEESCKLTTVAAVLESLTVWCLRSTRTDIDVLCASNSLQLLFTNVLRKPLRIEVENKLRGFLETLLSKDAPAASPVLPIIKSAVSIAVAELRSAVPQFLELATGAESVKLDSAVQLFVRKFVSHLLSFRAVIVRQLMAPESSRVSSRTPAPKAAPKALGVAVAPTTDAATLFNARDMLRQQSAAHLALFSSVQGVFGEGAEALDAAARAASVSEADVLAALRACLPTVDGDAKEQEAAVRAQMGRLRAEQAALLAPVAESTTKLDGDAAKLRTRRQELIKELDGIDEQLRGMVDQKAQLQRSVVDIDARFRQQLADLDSQSKGIAAIVGKLDAVPALHASLGRLSSELDTCKAHLKSASRGTTSAAAVISSRADYTDVSLAYLKVEKRCVEFLRQRIASTKEAAAKLQFEIARYEEFGMSQVLKDCAASAAKLKAEIAEDVTAVAYLCNEAVSVVRTFRTVVVDDDSVPLHPAELVLHHRLRAVAAAMGILFPLDKDLAGHDFTVVESVDEGTLWPLPAEPAADDDALMPAMLATIGVAAESLAPLNAAASPATDANPSAAGASSTKAGSAKLPSPAVAPATAPAAAAPQVALPSARVSPKKAAAPARVSVTPVVSAAPKLSWASKRLEPSAPVSLKSIIAEAAVVRPAQTESPAVSAANEAPEDTSAAGTSVVADVAAALPQRAGRKARRADD